MKYNKEEIKINITMTADGKNADIKVQGATDDQKEILMPRLLTMLEDLTPKPITPKITFTENILW